MPSSGKLCGGCGQVVGRTTAGIQCGSCWTWFHAKCTDIPKGSLAALSAPGASWCCPSCRSPAPRRAPSLAPPVSMPAAAVSDSASSTVTLESVYNMVKELRGEMKSMGIRYGEMIDSVQFCSDKVTEFESTMKQFQAQLKVIDTLNAENNALKKQVGELTDRVSELEQYSRRSNLEIQGVPQKDNENLTAILGSIGGFLGVPVSSSELDAVHRVPRGAGRASDASPKPIVVRFCSRLTRDQFLAAAKLKKRSAPMGSAPGLVIDGVSGRCFINEHLTPSNKILFGMAKRAAKLKNYKFVWTRDCKIFVRESDDTRPIYIKSAADVDRL